MQAPKDGDSPEYLTELRGLQERLQKRLDDPAPAPKPISFVTRNCEPEPSQFVGGFMRGFVEGLKPLSMALVRIEPHPQADATYYRLGEAGVRCSGLELVQAVDVEALGYAKGEALRLAFGEPGGCRYTPVDDDVPAAPQVAAWDGDYGTLRVNLPDGQREVLYVRVDVARILKRLGV